MPKVCGEAEKKGMRKALMSTFLGTLLTNTVLYWATTTYTDGSVKSAVTTALIASAISTGSDLIHYIWEGRPTELLLMNQTYNFLLYSASAALMMTLNGYF